MEVIILMVIFWILFMVLSIPFESTRYVIGPVFDFIKHASQKIRALFRS